MSTMFTCPVVAPVVKNFSKPLMKLHLYFKGFIIRKQNPTEVVKLIKGYSNAWVWLQGSHFFLCVFARLIWSSWTSASVFQCSKSCEGGFRVREVRCLSDDMTASTHCDPQLKPEEKEPCNTQDCTPEIGKEKEASVLTMELHLVEEKIILQFLEYIFFIKFRVLFSHKIHLFYGVNVGFNFWLKMFSL